MKKINKILSILCLMAVGSVSFSSCEEIINQSIDVNYVAEPGGHIEGATQQSVFLWSKTTEVTAVPDGNHKFAGWTVNKKNYVDTQMDQETRSDSFGDFTNTSYTFTAHFEFSKNLTVTFESNTGGLIKGLDDSGSTVIVPSLTCSIQPGQGTSSVEAVYDTKYDDGDFKFLYWYDKADEEKTPISTELTFQFSNILESKTFCAEFKQEKASVKLSLTNVQKSLADIVGEESKKYPIGSTTGDFGINIDGHVTLEKWYEANTGIYYTQDDVVPNIDFSWDLVNNHYRISITSVDRNYNFKPIFQIEQVEVHFSVDVASTPFAYIDGMTNQTIPKKTSTTKVEAKLNSSTLNNTFNCWKFYTNQSLTYEAVAGEGCDFEFEQGYSETSSSLIIKNINVEQIYAVANFKPSLFIRFQIPKHLQKGYNGSTTHNFAILKGGPDDIEPTDISYTCEILLNQAFPQIYLAKNTDLAVTQEQLDSFSILDGWYIQNFDGSLVEFTRDGATLNSYFYSSDENASNAFQKKLASLIETNPDLAKIRGTQNDPYVFIPRTERSNFLVEFTTSNKDEGIVQPIHSSIDETQIFDSSFTKFYQENSNLFDDSFNESNISIQPKDGYALKYIYEANKPNEYYSYEDFLIKYKGNLTPDSTPAIIDHDIKFVFCFDKIINDDKAYELNNIYSNDFKNSSTFNSLLKILLNDTSTDFQYSKDLINQLISKTKANSSDPLSLLSTDIIDNSKNVLGIDSPLSSLIIEFGGLKWHAVYFENVKKPNQTIEPILTLWLVGQENVNNFQSTTIDGSNSWPQTFNNTFLIDMKSNKPENSIEKTGQIYSRFSLMDNTVERFALPTSQNEEQDLPTMAQYGRSSLATDTLCNPGSYYQWTNENFMIEEAIEQRSVSSKQEESFSSTSYENNPFNDFTRGNFSSLIETPYTGSSYQKNESSKNFLGETYDLPNEGYGFDDNIYDSNYQSNFLNFSRFFSNAGANEWQHNRVWLPSYYEVGCSNDADKKGYWGVTDYQRQSVAFEDFDLTKHASKYSESKMEFVNGKIISGTLLRSYKTSSSTTPDEYQMYISADDGSLKTTSFLNYVGIRPCIQLNLLSLYTEIFNNIIVND